MLRRGSPLPEAMGSLFPRDVDLLVRIGDATGTLPQALHAPRRRVPPIRRLGVPSPSLRLSGLGLDYHSGFSSFILYFIVPKFEAIFNDFDMSLPEVTIAVIRTSHFLVKYFYLLFPPILLLELFLFVGAPWRCLESFESTCRSLTPSSVAGIRRSSSTRSR